MFYFLSLIALDFNNYLISNVLKAQTKVYATDLHNILIEINNIFRANTVKLRKAFKSPKKNEGAKFRKNVNLLSFYSLRTYKHPFIGGCGQNNVNQCYYIVGFVNRKIRKLL